jgi:tetratricopeptide (TPR) repeat protein
VALSGGPPLEPEERAALHRFLELRARAAPAEAEALGALAFDLGRYRDALAAHRRGGSFEARLGAGLCLLKLEDPDARAWFDALAAERPDEPRLPFYRGLAEAAAFRFDDAAARFEEALAREPDHRGALVELARCRERLGRFDEAEAALERLARLDPRGAARLEELRRRRARAW